MIAKQAASTKLKLQPHLLINKMTNNFHKVTKALLFSKILLAKTEKYRFRIVLTNKLTSNKKSNIIHRMHMERAVLQVWSVYNKNWCFWEHQPTATTSKYFQKIIDFNLHRRPISNSSFHLHQNLPYKHIAFTILNNTISNSKVIASADRSIVKNYFCILEFTQLV